MRDNQEGGRQYLDLFVVLSVALILAACAVLFLFSRQPPRPPQDISQDSARIRDGEVSPQRPVIPDSPKQDGSKAGIISAVETPSTNRLFKTPPSTGSSRWSYNSPSESDDDFTPAKARGKTLRMDRSIGKFHYETDSDDDETIAHDSVAAATIDFGLAPSELDLAAFTQSSSSMDATGAKGLTDLMARVVRNLKGLDSKREEQIKSDLQRRKDKLVGEKDNMKKRNEQLARDYLSKSGARYSVQNLQDLLGESGLVAADVDQLKVLAKDGKELGDRVSDFARKLEEYQLIRNDITAWDHADDKKNSWDQLGDVRESVVDDLDKIVHHRCAYRLVDLDDMGIKDCMGMKEMKIFFDDLDEFRRLKRVELQRALEEAISNKSPDDARSLLEHPLKFCNEEKRQSYLARIEQVEAEAAKKSKVELPTAIGELIKKIVGELEVKELANGKYDQLFFNGVCKFDRIFCYSKLSHKQKTAVGTSLVAIMLDKLVENRIELNSNLTWIEQFVVCIFYGQNLGDYEYLIGGFLGVDAKHLALSMKIFNNVVSKVLSVGQMHGFSAAVVWKWAERTLRSVVSHATSIALDDHSKADNKALVRSWAALFQSCIALRTVFPSGLSTGVGALLKTKLGDKDIKILQGALKEAEKSTEGVVDLWKKNKQKIVDSAGKLSDREPAKAAATTWKDADLDVGACLKTCDAQYKGNWLPLDWLRVSTLKAIVSKRRMGPQDWVDLKARNVFHKEVANSLPDHSTVRIKTALSKDVNVHGKLIEDIFRGRLPPEAVRALAEDLVDKWMGPKNPTPSFFVDCTNNMGNYKGFLMIADLFQTESQIGRINYARAEFADSLKVCMFENFPEFVPDTCKNRFLDVQAPNEPCSFCSKDHATKDCPDKDILQDANMNLIGFYAQSCANENLIGTRRDAWLWIAKVIEICRNERQKRKGGDKFILPRVAKMLYFFLRTLHVVPHSPDQGDADLGESPITNPMSKAFGLDYCKLLECIKRDIFPYIMWGGGHAPEVFPLQSYINKFIR